MGASSVGRAGDIASDLAIILITATQFIFFVYFHRYISWPVTGPDGTVTRISMLTDNYFTWLRFPIVASVIVIIASFVTIIYNQDWLRQVTSIAFSLLGLTVVGSLLILSPFDFSVLPNATAAKLVPKIATGFFICMAAFYGIWAIVESIRLFSSFR